MGKQYSFNNVPVLRHSRSRFDLSHSVKTSGNVGTLYPFDVQEVYAGDTFKIKTNVVSRLQSQFIRPVMDNLFLDLYYFFVPSRLLYDKFVNVFGENTLSAWANSQEYEIPYLDSGVIASKTVADYMGLPVGAQLNGEETAEVSVLPFRAFAKIYDEWFRDQNNVSPMHIQIGETTSSERFNANDWAPNNYTGLPPKVAKLHDYFTSALPAPQKGNAVDVPISDSWIPVYSREVNTQPDNITDGAALRFDNTLSGSGFHSLYARGNNEFSSLYADISNSPTPSSATPLYPANLWADGSSIGSPSVNDLRFAFQYQKMLERDARSGSRYVEYLASHFGVQAGDYRLQRSEYLGGRRIPISITQVAQTTGEGSTSSPLGSLGAYSLSGGRTRFTKSFVEHGYVIGVYCIRQFHSYQQGIEKFWRRFKRTEFYDPVFSHIGEQPVYKSELYGTVDNALIPFGYQEAWADLRMRPNRITGQMRSGIADSFDVWHFADMYSNAPTLNEQFINENPTYVDRAITVPSSSADQFILDFYIENIAYRTLPTYSVPSLIDHD